jgi:hypothetical protein
MGPEKPFSSSSFCITQIPGMPLAEGVSFPFHRVFLIDATFKRDIDKSVEVAPTISGSEDVRDLRKLH